MTYTTWVFNKLPHWKSGYSPEENFTRIKSNHVELNRARIWGSPLYILDPKLQNEQKIPKWDKRSTTGLFLGFFEHHSSTVSIVLNITTGSTTPQFNVVHYEFYIMIRLTPDLNIQLCS